MNTVKWRNQGAESKILWDHLRTFFNITLIEELFYQGVIAASEFTVYAATKLYFPLNISFNSSYASVAAHPYCRLFNEANALFFIMGHVNMVFNGAAGHSNSCDEYYNYYFSRIEVSQISYMKFIGYRLTYA